MGIRVRTIRRASNSYALSLELLEDRQLLSWSALAHAAPVFVGPVQTSAATSTPTPPSQAQPTNTASQSDSTPDDGEYANGAVDATANSFVGPVQTTSGTSYTSTAASTTGSYTKDYSQTSNDYFSYTYYKSSNAGQDYQADQASNTNESAATLDAKPPVPLVQASLLTRNAVPVVIAAIPPSLIAMKASDPAPTVSHLAANAISPSVDDTPTNAPAAPFVLTNHLRTALVLASETLGEQFVVSPAYVAAPILPVPQVASLLGGTVALDMANLRAAVDQFFARIDHLASDLGASPDLARWLLAGAAATGIFEFVRTKIRSAYKPWLGDDEENLWAPYPVLLLVPPEDEP